jgi:GH18 family chitinase
MRRFFLLVCAAAFFLLGAVRAGAQVSSVSAYDAADFRIEAYVPYWAFGQLNSFASSGMYSHVSDMHYFGGYRPDAQGNITSAAGSYATALTTMRTQAQTYGFKLHLSMFEVTGGQTDTTWESIIANPTYRQNFVTQVKNLMLGGAGTADDIQGFNFDWERPSNATEWGNYTQLARELRAAFKDPATPATNNWEVSVCDYGSTDSNWDATTLFDAKVYDRLMIMGYHYNVANYQNFTAGKRNLTQQGAAKAFSNNQLAIGVGTWGDGVGSAPTVTLPQIIAANGGSLAYDQLTYTGTIGSTTGTWNIESRKQVREKTQYAIDNGMPSTFTWTLHYDATNNLGLHRVMHHYAMVKTNTPDVNLDGKVNASDASVLANFMGTSTTNTGIGAAGSAQFDAFYLGGNWEKGDRDGNGFINQADADWLAGRYNALGVTLPDRLAYSGTFENFANSVGVLNRWKGVRGRFGELVETGNFTQHGANYLSFSGTGAGAARRSNNFVTMRNQSAAETTAGLNGIQRAMQADLETNIDLGQDTDTYVTFLFRENATALTPEQASSANRKLTFDFLDGNGNVQYDFALRGNQQSLSIESQADAAGEDVAGQGAFANATYMFVGKLSGNGAGANTLQASLFAVGSVVPDFTNPDFQWALSAHGSDGFNPIITDLQFTSQAGANYTVSNVWIGGASTILPPTRTLQGDFNQDGNVDSLDYVTWRKTMGQSGPNLVADGNGNTVVDAGDLDVWRAHFGMSVTGAAAGAAVPEPGAIGLLIGAVFAGMFWKRR